MNIEFVLPRSEYFSSEIDRRQVISESIFLDIRGHPWQQFISSEGFSLANYYHDTRYSKRCMVVRKGFNDILQSGWGWGRGCGSGCKWGCACEWVCMRVCVWMNLRVCASGRKAEWVAVKAPTQPHPKDLCTNEVVTLAILHQIHSNSSNFRIHCFFDYPMYCRVLKFWYSM